MYIPSKGNILIERVPGDGFMTIGLPLLIHHKTLIIASPHNISKYYRKYKNKVSPFSIRDYVIPDDIDKILIDFRLFRIKSKGHKYLKKLCAGKKLIFINSPKDVKEMSSMLELLSVSKDVNLRVIVFNRFNELRTRRYGR